MGRIKRKDGAELARVSSRLATGERVQNCIQALVLQVVLMRRLFTADADQQTGYGNTGTGAEICKMTAENVEPCTRNTRHNEQ